MGWHQYWHQIAPELLSGESLGLRVCLENGAEGQDRTADTTIFSRVLYQLSYLGMPQVEVFATARAIVSQNLSSGKTCRSHAQKNVRSKLAPHICIRIRVRDRGRFSGL